MSDINLNFVDDDFEFNKINISNPFIDLEEELKEENEPIKIEQEKKEDIVEEQSTDENDDIFNGIYKSMEKYSKLQGNLNDYKKELELLKLDYQKIQDDFEFLNKKYNISNEEITKLNIELKRVKENLAEKEKKILMLKTLLQLIIRKYGTEEITKITRLNIEQLKNI